MLRDIIYPRFYQNREFQIVVLLAICFTLSFFFFNQFVHLFLTLGMVLLIQYYPLNSRFTEYLIFLVFPIIGLTASVHECCLNYNSTTLFILCRSFAINRRLRFRHIVAFLMLIASWPFYFGAPLALYMGAISHGIMHPMNFFFLTRRARWMHYLVFLMPIYIGLDNLIQYKKYFVAFWDLEIFLVYLFWHLGYNKETVVKRLILFSLPVINFAQIYWDICPITVLENN